MKKYQIIIIGGPEYIIEAKGFEYSERGFYRFYDNKEEYFLYTPINLTIIKPL